MDKKKFLIVDDFQIHHIIFERELKEHFEILSALNCEKAHELLVKHPDPDIVAVDARSDNSKAIFDFVIWIREIHKYKGPIVAISNNEECQKGLIAVGCDYQCEKPLYKEKVIELLNAHARALA